MVKIIKGNYYKLQYGNEYGPILVLASKDNDDFNSVYGLDSKYFGSSRDKYYGKASFNDNHPVTEDVSEMEKQWLQECIKQDRFVPFEELNFNLIHELWW